jgi:hypothetical protein
VTDALHDVEAREHGRLSALAGREIFVNPFITGEAELWFIGYRSVPDAERGSQPELLARFHTVHAKARKSSRPFGMTALGLRRRPGAFDAAIQAEVDEAEARTPKPWAVDGVGL